MRAIKNYVVSIWRDTRGALSRTLRDRAAIATWFLLALPWFALWAIRENLDWIENVAKMIGIAFVFWWMSRSDAARLPEIKKPRAEFLFALALIILWALWRVGICAKLFFFLPPDFVCYKSWEIEILPKVIEQVIFPILVLFGAGYGWRAQGIDWNWRAWWIALPILIAMLGYGIYLHWNDLPTFGKNSVEFFFGAGLPEEVLFRAILLTRLEAWWRNSAWALFGASVIFGLIHLPINLLVFHPNNAREAWLTALTFQMGFGAVFVFAYQRTRKVMPLALIHAIVDAL